MKNLLIILLLSPALFAEPHKTPSLMECEMNIEMFDFGIEQGNPVTKVQVVGVIETCNGHVKYQKRVSTMKELLETL